MLLTILVYRNNSNKHDSKIWRNEVKYEISYRFELSFSKKQTPCSLVAKAVGLIN